jgi:ATP-dependent helicase/nuclease subunit B
VTHRSAPSDLVGAPLDGLRRELVAAKGDDPLAPVTVLAPSGYAAVFGRRALGAGSGVGGRRGWANVSWTTVPSLLRVLGGPALAARGLRPAPPAVDLEVIRTEATRATNWLGHLSSHPSALVELQRALVELRRCPPVTLDAIERGHPRGGDFVDLLGAVRRILHDCGLADGGEVAAAALGVARGGASAAPVRALGPVVSWQLGAVGATEGEVLRLVGARPVDDGPDRGRRVLTELRACADPDEEARRAVRSIVAAAEAGVPLWQQAIFHPPGPTYARILHQHLADATVASNGPEWRPLHRSMTGRALLGLLELADSDWPRHQVLGWLSAAPVTVGPGGPPVPATRWDVVSAGAGVVSGPDQWRERLGRLVRHGGAEADEATALASFTEDLFERATASAGSWGDFGRWAVGLLDHYLRPGTDRERWPVEEQAAAHQVRTVVSTLADLDRVSSGTDLTSFRRTLSRELERTVVDSHQLGQGGFGDGVFLAPYAAARGLRFPTVVVVGLADALVPGPGGDGGLLGDDLRRMDTSGTLATRSDRREAARRDLLDAVTCGTDERIATFPRGDSRSGRAQVPTRWLGDLVGPDTGRRDVDSFAAGLADAEPALSAQEFELRQLDRWVGAGGDPACAPAGRHGRLALGFEAWRGRLDTRFTRFDGNVGPGLVSAFDPGTPVSATRFET